MCAARPPHVTAHHCSWLQSTPEPPRQHQVQVQEIPGRQHEALLTTDNGTLFLAPVLTERMCLVERAGSARSRVFAETGSRMSCNSLDIDKSQIAPKLQK